MCELIYHVLHVFLLRRQKVSQREKGSELNRHTDSSMLLQPIIDSLQYRVFCDRVEAELRKAVKVLNAVGIPTSLSFTAVTESGPKLVSILSEESKKTVGGEAVIRVDNW